MSVRIEYEPCFEVCSSKITVELEDGVITYAAITDGCMGNTSAISQLAKGMRADFIIERLGGIKCGHRSTSCPDQFARALKKALEAEEAKKLEETAK